MKCVKEAHRISTDKRTINTKIMIKHLIKLGIRFEIINLTDFDPVRVKLEKEVPQLPE